jgi:hypothetical protein
MQTLQMKTRNGVTLKKEHKDLVTSLQLQKRISQSQSQSQSLSSSSSSMLMVESKSANFTSLLNQKATKSHNDI